MKKFMRSTAGKIINSTIIIICAGLMLLSLVGAAVAVKDDFYSKSEEEILLEYTGGNYSQMAFLYFDNSLNNLPVTRSTGTRGFEIKIEKDGAYMGGSNSYDAADGEEYMYTAVVQVPEGGDMRYRWHYTVWWGEGEERPDYESTANYEIYTVRAKFDADKIENSVEYKLISAIYSMRYSVFVILGISFITALVLFIALMCSAGRRPGDGEIHASALTAFPFDVELILYIGIVGTFLAIISEEISGPAEGIAVCTLALIVCGALGLLMAMDFAVKIKLHRLSGGMLCVRGTKFCIKLFRRLRETGNTFLKSLPMVWRTAVIVCVVIFADLIATGRSVMVYHGVYKLWWFLLRAGAGGLAIYIAIILRKLQKGGQEIADGNLSYKIDTKGLWWDFKKHAENLNAISGSVNKAVVQATKSERMKTELITNVSHDIKTPLTSIINYASLMAAESGENEELREHGEVLVRQSNKLKRLLEDLVDASRASNGNLDIDLMPCNAAVFITQAAGEYMDRLAASGLTLVTKVPETELLINADPRRMQRVFDNLLNNACKYSAHGTRVYLSLEKQGDKAVISFKNTSRDELDISPDELMERFVRGDNSRSTEGSGLGLSIARSLVELQGGRMNLNIDGDLFKVFLTFDVI